MSATRICKRIVALLAFLLVAACGSDKLTVGEYATEVEAMVAEMEARFAEIDAAWEAQRPTIEGAATYWKDRLDIRKDFLDALRALDPAEELEEMHATAIDLFTRMTTTDEALAARSATYDTIEDHHQWLDTPEGEASLAILEEVFTFCRASQDEFDATSEREPLEDVAWLPPEMKEVVKVAFGCPPP